MAQNRKVRAEQIVLPDSLGGSTSAPGLPSLTGRSAGHTHFDTLAQKMYVAAETPEIVTDDFTGAAATIAGTATSDGKKTWSQAGYTGAFRRDGSGNLIYDSNFDTYTSSLIYFSMSENRYMEAKATISSISTSATAGGSRSLYLRGTGGNGTVALRLTHTGSGYLECALYEVINGAPSYIFNFNTSGTAPAWAANDVIRLVVEDQTVTAYKNDTVLGSGTLQTDRSGLTSQVAIAGATDASNINFTEYKATASGPSSLAWVEAAGGSGGGGGGGGAVAESEWTTWTPSIFASTTNPTVGNGTLTGRYKHVGRRVYFTLNFVFGSTSTAGSGAWGFTLPVTPDEALDQVVAARILDAGTDNKLALGIIDNVSGRIENIVYEGGNVVTHDAAPITWAAGDAIEISGVYEAATDAGVSGGGGGTFTSGDGPPVVGTPTRRAVSSFDGTAEVNTASITLPTVEVGDLLLLTVSEHIIGSLPPEPAAPTGWTLVHSQAQTDVRMTVFSRVAQAGDSGSTVAVPFGANVYPSIGCVAYDNAVGVHVVEGAGGNGTTLAAATPAFTVGSAVVLHAATYSNQYDNNVAPTISGLTAPLSVTSLRQSQAVFESTDAASPVDARSVVVDGSARNIVAITLVLEPSGVAAPGEGDYYLDKINREIYGPYTGGSWGTPVPLANAEAVQDIIGAALVAGTGMTVTYDDAAGTVTLESSGGGGGGGAWTAGLNLPGTSATGWIGGGLTSDGSVLSISHNQASFNVSYYDAAFAPLDDAFMFECEVDTTGWAATGVFFALALLDRQETTLGSNSESLGVRLQGTTYCEIDRGPNVSRVADALGLTAGWHRLGLKVVGGVATAYIDGVKRGSALSGHSLLSSFPSGARVAIGVHGTISAKVRNIKTWSRELVAPAS